MILALTQVTEENAAERLESLLEGAVAFIDSQEFRDPEAEQRILDESDPHLHFEGLDADAMRSLRELPSHLARFCEAPLLTAEAERALFRRMNYAKYRANQLRDRLQRRNASQRWRDEAVYWLREAEVTRNRIVCSNLRLPISMVKKLSTPALTFDDLLSDALMSLLNAVEKFDYQRGYRFSTYAYRAISRNAYRMIADHSQRSNRFQARGEWLENEAPVASASAVPERDWGRLNAAMRELLETLSDRERMIVESRFALGADREPRTFQSLADELGVSKERVRQIEKRAVEKLQQRASKTFDQDSMLVRQEA